MLEHPPVSVHRLVVILRGWTALFSRTLASLAAISLFHNERLVVFRRPRLQKSIWLSPLCANWTSTLRQNISFVLPWRGAPFECFDSCVTITPIQNQIHFGIKARFVERLLVCQGVLPNYEACWLAPILNEGFASIKP